MKTLAGWIVGVFGLGMLLGSFYGNTAAEEEVIPETSLESVLRAAPLVDCGPGREAVLEPVVVDGKTSVKFKCVADAATPAPAPVVVASNPAPHRESRPVADAPARSERAEEVKEQESRSVKDSALIIGGAAGAGAGIGAIAKGKKGAALGAAIGGVAGTVYDLATRKPKR